MKKSRDVLIFNFTYENEDDVLSEIKELNIIKFNFETDTNEFISVKKDEINNFLSDSDGLIVTLTYASTVFSTKAIDDYHLRELIKEKPKSLDVIDDEGYEKLLKVNLSKFANIKGFFKQTFGDGFDHVLPEGVIFINELGSCFDRGNPVHDLYYWEIQLREAYKKNLDKKWFTDCVRSFPKQEHKAEKETKYQVVYVNEYGEVTTSRLFDTEKQAKDGAKRHKKKLCIVSFSYENPYNK